MKIVKAALVVVTLSFFGAILATGARAQSTNHSKRTAVTFSQSVEIPGQILPAGTYTIELLGDQLGDRHIVRISNADQTTVIATVLAIPNWRERPTGKTVMTFSERAGDAPDALKAWFYPGDNFGQEFVYPKHRALELAVAEKEPVPALTTDTVPVEEAELTTTPIVAETPEQQEVPVATVIQVTPPAAAAPVAAAPVAAAPVAAAPVVVAENNELPKTASLLPLVTLLGVMMIGSAFVLKRIAR